MIKTKKQAGFTMVELSLAIAFIAFMTMFILWAVIHLTRLYNKGITLRQINQSGRQIIDDLERNLRYASGVKYVASAQRLCTGSISYVWIKADNPSNSLVVQQNRFASSPNQQLKLVRVADSSGRLCEEVSPGQYPLISDELRTDSQELLGPQSAVEDITVKAVEGGAVQEIRVVLATPNVKDGTQNRPTYNSANDSYSCVTAGVENEFCAFGQFETAVYTRKYNVQ